MTSQYNMEINSRGETSRRQDETKNSSQHSIGNQGDVKGEDKEHGSPTRTRIKTPPQPLLKSAQKHTKNLTPEWPTFSSDASTLKADISFAARQQQENRELRTPTKPMLKSVEKSRRKITSQLFDEDFQPKSIVHRTLRFD